MRNELNQLTTELPFTPVTFMEIGSRDGHDTKHVADYWNLNPKDCYIIEAYPALCDRIKAQYPEFNTFGFAASNKIGTVEFNAVLLTDADHNIGISSVLECVAYEIESEKISVKANTISNFLNTLRLTGIDLVKIDVEGFTQEVLHGFGNKLKNIKAIQVETEKSEMWKGQKIHDDIVEFMESKGFTLLSKYDAWGNQYDCLFINNKASN
jgi:FkbM family methyltransferase